MYDERRFAYGFQILPMGNGTIEMSKINKMTKNTLQKESIRDKMSDGQTDKIHKN